MDESTSPRALTVLGGGATLGSASLAGFGSALSTADGGPNVAAGTGTDAYLAPTTLTSGEGDNVTIALTDAATGAFTFEALVRFDFDPMASLGTRNAPMQIFSAEQESIGGGVRVMQFRFDPAGFDPAADGFTSALSSPAIEFISLRDGSVEQKIVLLPTTGANAVAQGAWYHFAVTYTGAAGADGNLSFYWTRIDSAVNQAALLGTRTLASDPASGLVDFALGNTGRHPSQNNFVGALDEVRISSVARTAGQFIFHAEADGSDDAREMDRLGSLAQTPALPAGDFDGDGFTDLAEFEAGSLPKHAASTPNDVDAEGLPDAWEKSFFGTLAQAGADDNDGDGATNLAEFQAGSLPTNALSLPPGSLTKFIPIDDGNPATSEYGYGGGSNINGTAFICSGLKTVGDKQFMTYYGRHQTDPTYAFNNTLWVARRTVGAAQWQVFRTSFTANNITDGHDVIAFGIDGEGVMHISWGMHGNPFHYARTTTPVTGTQNIVFGADQTMTGSESVVTYPQFLTRPNGDLLYLFREGNSSAGDTYLNRYTLANRSWANVHRNGTAQAPFIKGTGWSPDYTGYPNMPCLDAAGNFTLVWTWRYGGGSPAGESGYQTNTDFAYAKSLDGGVTWRRQNGTTYSLPISKNAESGVENTRAERVVSIPEGSSLINQAGMCLDQTGQPVIASWWAPGTPSGNYRRQYMVAFPTPTGWQTRQVSQRTIDPTTSKIGEANVRELGRPVVVTDAQDRIIVLWRDNEGTNGLTVAHSLPRAQDPDRLVWTRFDLTTENLGNYEPVIDLARWQLGNVLHVLYQPSAGLGYTPPANTASQIGVLEWDAATYFKPSPAVNVAFTNQGRDAALSFASQVGWGYRLFTSTELTDWSPLTTLNGTGGNLQYTHVNGGSGDRRFWRVEIREGGFPP